MVPRDFLPWNVFVGAAEPKEAVGLDEDFLGREVNLLGNEAAAEKDGGYQVGLGAEWFDGGNALLPSEVVPAAGAFGGLVSGGFGALRTTFTIDAAAAVSADIGGL